MSIFESLPEAPDMRPLMEAFKTMARQMNLMDDQPVINWSMLWVIGVMIFLLMVGFSLLSYWWATNPKTVEKKNNKPGSKASKKKTQTVEVLNKTARRSPRKSKPRKVQLDK